jgi:hypothetical protein
VIVDQVEVAVGEDKPDIDLGPLAKKLGDDRQDVQPPKTTGAVMTRSPRGAACSPDAARSASLTSSRMRRAAAR